MTYPKAANQHEAFESRDSGKAGKEAINGIKVGFKRRLLTASKSGLKEAINGIKVGFKRRLYGIKVGCKRRL